MTNLEIIISECINHEIYTEEEIETMLVCGLTPSVHTFAKWNELGYKVKKGEHATICTKLWKPKTNKVKKGNKTVIEEDETRMYLCKAYLFTKEQVEYIGA